MIDALHFYSGLKMAESMDICIVAISQGTNEVDHQYLAWCVLRPWKRQLMAFFLSLYFAGIRSLAPVEEIGKIKFFQFMVFALCWFDKTFIVVPVNKIKTSIILLNKSFYVSFLYKKA
ncbi:hypothetical protein CEXT_491031 [Caerostris extrusa]|uniref:Uncharacterized protein n=1 Tax=Caerostris extrusa TaxID=172846 RepID=A0AAV4YCW9_CAEEX|nr:hypothetical protein CEXT_491031 [Caerostris extrusa]